MVLNALKAQHQVYSGCLEEPEGVRERDGVTVVGFGCSARMLTKDRKNIATKVEEFCRKNRIEIVITHRYKPCDIVSKIGKSYTFKKKIAVFHGRGEFDRLGRKLFARYALRSWQLVAVSDAVKENMLGAFCGFRRDQIRVIYNALNLSAVKEQQFSKEKARELLNIPKNEFVMGSIGRLVPNKGYLFLLKALSNIEFKGKLVLIGDGRQRGELEASALALGIHDKVIFAGNVDQAYRFVKAFDLFVLPSIEEAFGMVLLEAIAGEVPAIGSDAGGIPEVLGDNALLARAGTTNPWG
ncbi:MAG: glycosyltransferase [Porticoccaceae bacterium]